MGVAVLDMEYLLALIDALDGKAALTHKCMTISGARSAPGNNRGVSRWVAPCVIF